MPKGICALSGFRYVRHSDENLSAAVRLATCVRVSALPLFPESGKSLGVRSSCFSWSHLTGTNAPGQRTDSLRQKQGSPA